MDLALIGYGKMGQEVEKAAVARKHRLTARIDPACPDLAQPAISAGALAGVQAAIEFTHPEAALENIRALLSLKIPLVVGTTGWYSHLAEVSSWVDQHQAALVYAPNFSLGVNLFYRIAEKAVSLLGAFESYDVALAEVHHRHKVDSPSGTAKKLADIVLQNHPRKKRVTSESLNRAIAPEELHLISLRSGEFPGTHTLTFDSQADTIELQHTARSRAGLALGAVLAAEWVVGKQGVFTFDHVLEDLLNAGK